MQPLVLALERSVAVVLMLSGKPLTSPTGTARLTSTSRLQMTVFEVCLETAIFKYMQWFTCNACLMLEMLQDSLLYQDSVSVCMFSSYVLCRVSRDKLAVFTKS